MQFIQKSGQAGNGQNRLEHIDNPESVVKSRQEIGAGEKKNSINKQTTGQKHGKARQELTRNKTQQSVWK